MCNIKFIEKKEPFFSLITKFRNKACTGEELKTAYKKLGSIFAIELANYIAFKDCNIVTPMDKEYIGTKCNENNNLLFVSTFEDNENFSKTIGEFYGVQEYAKLDVDRAEKGWKANLVRFEFPENIDKVKTVVFCKSVLATGCTAKTILKKICEVCNPEGVLVISIISSNEAIEELKNEYKYLNIEFLIGEIDELEIETGLLVPGVGMIEERLKVVANL